MKIAIELLTKDGLQTRVALDERTVQEYADSMRDGDKFPPVKVFEDQLTGNHWLADGFHRVEAATRAGLRKIDADLAAGTFVDALRWALSCNAKHGKRITNEDKENAMQMAWENRQELFGGDPSAALLASTCGVHRNTATAFINRHCAVPAAPQRPAARPPQVAQNVQPAAAPVRPVRTVVGTDGKAYPVRPMPQRPAPQVAQNVQPAATHYVPLDRYGTEIPVRLQPAFDSDELAEVYAQISSARTRLRFGLESNVPVFAAVRQDALMMLNNAYNFTKSAAPHCVCRMCQGQGCQACHNRGWQTEEEYERNPQEFKA